MVLPGDILETMQDTTCLQTPTLGESGQITYDRNKCRVNLLWTRGRGTLGSMIMTGPKGNTTFGQLRHLATMHLGLITVLSSVVMARRADALGALFLELDIYQGCQLMMREDCFDIIQISPSRALRIFLCALKHQFLFSFYILLRSLVDHSTTRIKCTAHAPSYATSLELSLYWVLRPLRQSSTTES